MKVGYYKIGRLHAIIKSVYEDGMITYETSFSDENDLAMSVEAVAHGVGRLIGTATKHPAVLKSYQVIRGKEAIIKELENAPEPEDLF